jgi:4,5-dihydroxyphthalate decarboxylase
MARIPLSFISSTSERVQPLLDGTVQPEGIELVPTLSDPSETFWRQLKFQEFELAEMSMSSYLIARSQGMDMIAIPAFPGRRFMHTQWSFHVDAGITTPSDLAGKRLGVGEYQQTASLWTRGIFEHDFGVSQYSVDWYMERSEELSHGGATGFTPPPNIKFHRIPADKSLASMLVNHEIDAAPVHRAFQRGTNIIDRSTQIRGREGDWSKVVPLFADRVAEGERFFKAHGYIPANHAYIIRGDIHRKYPWVAFNLYAAFVQAKELARERLAESIPSGLVFGNEYLAQTRRIFGEDPYPYGVKANRGMLETILDYSVEQGLTPSRLKIEDLFAPSTLDL